MICKPIYLKSKSQIWTWNVSEYGPRALKWDRQTNRQTEKTHERTGWGLLMQATQTGWTNIFWCIAHLFNWNDIVVTLGRSRGHHVSGLKSINITVFGLTVCILNIVCYFQHTCAVLVFGFSVCLGKILLGENKVVYFFTSADGFSRGHGVTLPLPCCLVCCLFLH